MSSVCTAYLCCTWLQEQHTCNSSNKPKNHTFHCTSIASLRAFSSSIQHHLKRSLMSAAKPPVSRCNPLQLVNFSALDSQPFFLHTSLISFVRPVYLSTWRKYTIYLSTYIGPIYFEWLDMGKWTCHSDIGLYHTISIFGWYSLKCGSQSMFFHFIVIQES